MNHDLKLRLTPYTAISDEERDFFSFLAHNLGWFALRKCKADSDISIYISPIENGEDDSAYMLGDDAHNFDIYLDSRMPLGMVIDFMIHEMAHVRSWHHGEKDDHGPEFGRAYAALYREYLKLYDLWWN